MERCVIHVGIRMKSGMLRSLLVGQYGELYGLGGVEGVVID